MLLEILWAAASTFAFGIIFNLKGKNVANMSFDMPASKVLPTGTRGEYILINTKYIQNIKLK